MITQTYGIPIIYSITDEVEDSLGDKNTESRHTCQDSDLNDFPLSIRFFAHFPILFVINTERDC